MISTIKTFSDSETDNLVDMYHYNQEVVFESWTW